jgi:serine/threonine protein kinase
MNGISSSRRLAHGETSDVFAVEHRGKPRALKVLHPHLADDPIIRSRFVREARTLCGVTHPHIVQVHELIEHDGRPAMLMELASGGSLSDRRQTLDAAIALLRDLLGALATLHRHGIVHRDIRPSHILFAEDDTVKLVDFGMASIRNLSGLTRSTVFTSRPHYADPFSWGRGRADPVQDLYSMGAVIFETLTGAPPPLALFSRDRSARERVLADFRAGTDHPVATIVCALMDEPARRPRSASEVLLWLEAGDVTAGRRLAECIYCGDPMPAESAVCMRCGRTPPVIRRDRGGEFIALKKISEDQAILSPFLRKLQLLSAGSEPIPRLLIGDVRLYSRAEQKGGLRLPVRIAENIAPESVPELIRLLEGEHPDKIHITRYAMRAAGRVKRGPLISVKDGLVVPEATIHALRQVGRRTDATPGRPEADAISGLRTPVASADSRGGADLKREAAHALAVAAGRLVTPTSRTFPLDSETIDELGTRLFAVISHVHRTEAYLEAIDLHVAYADLERAGVNRSATHDAHRRAEDVFAAYADAERTAARTRASLVEICRILEGVRSETFAEDLRRVRAILDSCTEAMGPPGRVHELS